MIAGFGIGGMSSITPVFVSENYPPRIRGRVAGLFQEFLVIGVTMAYWLCYGVGEDIAPTTKQWRIPIAFQLVPGALMPEVLVKFPEIKAAVEHEVEETQNLTWREVLQSGNGLRFVNCFIMMFWQQFSGTNSIGYYAPQLFQTIGGTGGNTSLFTTGIYGIVKVVATGIFLIGIDKFGRRWSLVVGGWWMSAVMFVLGAVLVSKPPTLTQTAAAGSPLPRWRWSL